MPELAIVTVGDVDLEQRCGAVPANVWRYEPVALRPGQSTLRLIVSSDIVNEVDLPVVLALHLVDEDPDSLLAVHIGDHG